MRPNISLTLRFECDRINQVFYKKKKKKKKKKKNFKKPKKKKKKKKIGKKLRGSFTVKFYEKIAAKLLK